MKKKFLVLMIAMLTLAMTVLAGCGNSGGGEEDPLADGVLSVAVDDTYLPMEFRDDQNNLVGFDIDLANALAEDLGVKVEFTTVAWDGIFNGLNAKQYDAIISSTSITPERQEGFNQTNPYVSNGIIIVSRKDAEPVTTFEGLEGKRVGVQLATTADEATQKLAEQKGVTMDLKQFDGMLDAFSALEGSQIDNVVTDIGVAMYYVAQKPDVFAVTSPVLTNEPIAITVRKGEDAFTEKLNESLKKLQENGTMTEISMKWFGKDMTSDIDTELHVVE
ncbi:MAG: ABC transporter substrate-binding protein [Eubacterium sp.]|nr:ABC transporter substrate-binding protein [Eubacterium sp.]